MVGKIVESLPVRGNYIRVPKIGQSLGYSRNRLEKQSEGKGGLR